MPPKRTQAKKRTLRAADGGPPAQRSRRQSTRNATLASQATASTVAEGEPSVGPALDRAQTTSQRLDPELVQSLVSTVTTEVTRQLTATLPAIASQLRPSPPVATLPDSDLVEDPACPCPARCASHESRRGSDSCGSLSDDRCVTVIA